MKPPKILSMSQNDDPQQEHSSLLPLAVLIMVMLSGLLYLGARVKQQPIEKTTVPVNHPVQNLPESTKANLQKSVPQSFEKIITTLKSQQLINPVMYKTIFFLKNEEVHDDTQSHAALWQQGQQQLTLIQATVYAGIDLSELTPQMLSTKSPITLYLPPARIILTQINNVTMYDVKTGQPSTVQMGLSLTRDQEKNIKAQVERQFCESEMLQTTTEDTRQHVISLLDAMNISIVVRVAEPVGCSKTAS